MYEFVNIHRATVIVKDVDDVSSYIYPLIYQYIITVSRLHTENITRRIFAYSFDVFIRYNNLHHIITSYTLSVSITVSLVIFIPILYHTP